MTRNLDVIQVQLQDQLSRLLGRAGAVSRDLRAPHDDDAMDRATERENDEVLEVLDDVTRRDITDVRQALGRIQRGAYGVCEVCQRPIEQARLEAMPTATRCVKCAAGV